MELLTLQREDWQRVAEDPVAFATRLAVELGAEVGLVRSVAEQTVALLQRTGALPPWTGYLAMNALRTIVGTCSYTAPPDAEGIVEIAYFTFPAHEGRGYASSMARGLVDRAIAAPKVHRIRAHTLPEPNASTRILEKLGFARSGEAEDPDVGTVWRWERAATA